MSDELEHLKRELGGLGARGRGYRYPKSLREAVVEHVRRARRAGRTWQELTAELGITALTLQRWSDEQGTHDALPLPVRTLHNLPADGTLTLMFRWTTTERSSHFVDGPRRRCTDRGAGEQWSNAGPRDEHGVRSTLDLVQP